VNYNKLCLDLAESLLVMYEEAGRDTEELSANLAITKERLASNKINQIDRTYTQLLTEAVKAAGSDYVYDKTIGNRAIYYYAIAAHCVWCAIQHCACGAIRPAVEAAGKSIGYCCAARCQDEENSLAMREASIAESYFLRPYEKLGIIGNQE